MNPDRRRKLIQAQLHKGYTHIYEDLVAIWSRETLWDGALVLTGLLTLAILGPLYWSSLGPVITLVVSVAVFLAGVSFLYLWLIFSLSVSASLDPQKEVPVLSVRIMTAVRQPYNQKASGLGYRDVEHLRRIAEIEQGAADWRGSFVSFVIIGTLSVLIWGAPYIWTILNNQQNTGAVQPLLPYVEPIWGDSLLAQLVVLSVVIVVIVGIFWVVATMYNYFCRFLASEAANRAILKACEESLAFFEKYDLKEQARFSLQEKRAIAAHFGCKIVPDHDALWADKLWTWGYEPDGTLWHLVPPPRNSRVQNLRLRLRHLRLSLRRYFGNGQS